MVFYCRIQKIFWTLFWFYFFFLQGYIKCISFISNNSIKRKLEALCKSRLIFLAMAEEQMSCLDLCKYVIIIYIPFIVIWLSWDHVPESSSVLYAVHYSNIQNPTWFNKCTPAAGGIRVFQRKTTFSDVEGEPSKADHQGTI